MTRTMMESAYVDGEEVRIQAISGNDALVVYPFRPQIKVFKNIANHTAGRTVADWDWIPLSRLYRAPADGEIAAD
jgi:hypothetical protein